MAWIATEDFEGYSDEATLNGASGGSGWSAAWSGANVVSDTAQASSGSVSARVVTAAGSNSFITRSLTSAVSGTATVYFSMRKSATGSGVVAFSIRNSGGSRGQVRLDASGNMQILNPGVAWSTFGSFSANTWYDFRVVFNTTGTYYASYWNGSSWTDSTAYTLGGSGDITIVGMGGDIGADAWIDNITGTDTHPGGGGGSSFVPRVIMF